MADIQSLAGGCYIASDIAEGDVLKAGGVSMFGDSSPINVTADFSGLEVFMEKVDSTIAKNGVEGGIGYMKSIGIQSNPEIVAKLYLFQQVVEKYLRPLMFTDEQGRVDFYRAQGEKTSLSDAINEGHLACLELSMFSVKALEKHDVKASLVFGAHVDRKIEPEEFEPSQGHTFLMIDDPVSGDVIIYDPLNSIKVQGQDIWFPAVSSVPRDQYEAWLDRAKTSETFLEAEIEVSGKTHYFGAADCLRYVVLEWHVLGHIEENKASVRAQTTPPQPEGL